MESLELKSFSGVYQNRRVLLTGHTGFKGSWLALWLKMLGAEPTGMALMPDTAPSHWKILSLNMDEICIDIRDTKAVQTAFRKIEPEIVFHLAAQPLVRRSYRDPLETWSTNVMGTANILEACRNTESVQSIVVVTTDKCYENQEWEWGYREIDRLGGHDPYSASKAAVELLAASYRQAFFGQHNMPFLATARAGNVIGGGDWSEDRLIPDVVRAITDRCKLEVRSPEATRPWQHVLESLAGYLCLGQQLMEGKHECSQAWNFGPGIEGNRTVRQVLTELKKTWPAVDWFVTEDPQPHEASLLQLDSAKAQKHLAWSPVWSWQQGMQLTAEWYRAYMEQGAVKSQEQLIRYVDDARKKNVPWSLM